MLSRLPFLVLRPGLFTRRLLCPLTHVTTVSVVPFGDKKEVIQQKIEAYEEDKSFSPRQKLKLLVRDYGASVMVVHVSISLFSLAACYSMLRAGLPLTDLTMITMGKEEHPYVDMVATGGTFTLAYIIHKSLFPFRIALTAVVTPVLVTTLRKKGILKPMADKAKKNVK